MQKLWLKQKQLFLFSFFNGKEEDLSVQRIPGMAFISVGFDTVHNYFLNKLLSFKRVKKFTLKRRYSRGIPLAETARKKLLMRTRMISQRNKKYTNIMHRDR